MWLLLLDSDRNFELCIDADNYYSTIDNSMFQKLPDVIEYVFGLRIIAITIVSITLTLFFILTW